MQTLKELREYELESYDDFDMMKSIYCGDGDSRSLYERMVYMISTIQMNEMLMIIQKMEDYFNELLYKFPHCDEDDIRYQSRHEWYEALKFIQTLKIKYLDEGLGPKNENTSNNIMEHNVRHLS